jgi:hypothetical protein
MKNRKKENTDMIVSDGEWRNFLYRYEVPEEILASEFGYLSEDEQDGFFTFEDSWYHLSMFTFADIEGWHGIYNETAFSCVLIEISDDTEQYKIGKISY